jgi:hypothetical protein
MSHRKRNACPYKEICYVIVNIKREPLHTLPSHSNCPKPDLPHPEPRLRPLDKIAVIVRDNKVLSHAGVTLDWVLYWILYLLTTYAHDS